MQHWTPYACRCVARALQPLGRTALLVPLLLLAMAPVAQATDAPALKPYQLQYLTRAYGMSMAMDRELAQQDNGLWTLTNGGSVMLAGFTETARFAVAGGSLFPASYVFRGRGLAGRPREVHFDHGKEVIRSLHRNTWHELPYGDNTLDRLSQQEQLRLTLLRAADPRQDFAIEIADGRKIKQYVIAYQGEALVSTPLGEIPTLHFMRERQAVDGDVDPDERSEIWLAPDWDFLIVRMVHEDNGRPIEATLTGGTLGTQPLQLPPALSSANRR